MQGRTGPGEHPGTLEMAGGEGQGRQRGCTGWAGRRARLRRQVTDVSLTSCCFWQKPRQSAQVSRAPGSRRSELATCPAPPPLGHSQVCDLGTTRPQGCLPLPGGAPSAPLQTHVHPLPTCPSCFFVDFVSHVDQDTDMLTGAEGCPRAPAPRPPALLDLESSTSSCFFLSKAQDWTTLPTGTSVYRSLCAS